MCQVKEFFYPSSDGISTIRAREWRPDGAPSAVVQISHGVDEHLERYDDFARFLARNGFLVIANDHLGHGRTAKVSDDRGFFAQKNGWLHVVEDMEILRGKTAEENPNLPYFMLGHSMGSFLARTYLIRYPGRLTGAVLSGTGQQKPALVSFGIGLTSLIGACRGRRYRSALVQGIAFGSNNRRFKPNRTPADWLTRDTAIVDGHLKDELCGFVPTVGLYHDMMTGIRFDSSVQNLRKMDKMMPVLFFSGALDPVGEETVGLMRAVEGFRNAGCRDVTVKVYPEGRHEMLNEINRTDVYNDVLAWLRSKIPVKMMP